MSKKMKRLVSPAQDILDISFRPYGGSVLWFGR
jgi:hypothetical protein